MNENPLMVLAEASAGWAQAPLSAQVEKDARRAVLDWFASLLPGCKEGPAPAMAVALAHGRGEGAAVAYVDGSTGSARHAALLNGIASHTAEFDDIYRDGGYHPGSPTISAALAVAQEVGASQEAFLRAVVGGYEMGCRVALALQPSHYRNWHITATVGTLGAAAATAMLKGGDAHTVAHAVAIASSFAGGHQENLQGQGQTKPFHCGHAADAGVLAGLAACAGATGSLDSLHAAHGYAAATSDGTGNWSQALEGIGSWTPISRMTFKNHGCCGHIFPTLDGLAQLGRKTSFEAGQVRRLEVQGYAATKSICDRMDVRDARDARFSLQYCVAAQLVLGRVRLAAFTDEALSDPRLRELMSRVSVEVDPQIAAAYPGRRMARLRLELSDGRVLDHFQETRKGDPDDPLSDAELGEKFDELAAAALPRGTADALKTQILEGNTLIGPLVGARAWPAEVQKVSAG